MDTIVETINTSVLGVWCQELRLRKYSIDGGDNCFQPNAEDTSRVTKLGADVTGTRLTGEFFENNLVRRVGPRPPMATVRGAKDHNQRCLYGGGNMGDSRIVTDKNLRLRCQCGDLGKGEIVENCDRYLRFALQIF